MDLRPYQPSREQIQEASELACRGLICYQPFEFSDGLITGAGYEFAKVAEGAGMVYLKDLPPRVDRASDFVQRHLIAPEILNEFRDFNRRLAVLYDSIIDLIVEKIGDPKALTFADVGSCTGYFPYSFALRGAKRAVGFDAVDYRRAYRLMNSILRTKAEFRHQAYNSESGAIRNAGTFDVCTSIAVLVHLSDPLQHLAFLGKMARRALFVWTYTSENEEDHLAIHYQSQNRYYKSTRFPYCFDVMQISPALLRRSLELMGFTEIHQLKNCPAGMPDYWFERQRGYLAIRPNSAKLSWGPEPTHDNSRNLARRAKRWLARQLRR